MVDLHCHCLPGLDDGTVDLAEAVALCRLLAAEGVGTVVATPHQLGRYGATNGVARVQAAVGELTKALAAAEIPLTVLPGGDVRVQDNLPAALDAGDACTVGDARRWVLLEMPETVALDIGPLLTELQGRGISCLLTHPERYAWIDGVFPQILRWRNTRGMLLQITAGSLLGGFGPESERRAWQWLENGLVDIIASDAHGPQRRPPRLAAARAAIVQRCGEKVAARVLPLPRAARTSRACATP